MGAPVLPAAAERPLGPPGPARVRADPRNRRLAAARLAGTGLIAVFGQLAVDSPHGAFGPTGTVTATGAAFSVLVGLVVALGVVALRRPPADHDDGPGRFLTGLGAVAPAVLVALAIGAFVPALADDLPVAGGVALWAVAHLSRLLFPLPPGPRPEAADPLAAWLERNGPAIGHLLRVSILVTTAAIGYRVGGLPARLLCLLFGLTALALAAPALRRMAAEGRRRLALPALLVGAALLASGAPTVALGLFAAAQGSVLLLLLAGRPIARELADAFSRRPALLVVGSFVALIAAGTLLLSFPAAAAGPRAIAPIDALFTATSAVCVTGLVVLDTARDFSLFGQIVILVLIQAGGLSIMVLSTFAAVLLGRSLGLRAEQALADALDLDRAHSGSAYPLIRFIVGATLVCEATGAAILAVARARQGADPLDALWHGLFHAVSAFCNAGFALHSDSLIAFQTAPSILLVVATLIVAGGLGFPVLAASWLRLRRRVTTGLPIQVLLVLAASAFLVVVGTIGFAVFEWNRALAGLSAPDKLVNALFQSVSLRTAGFNSVTYDLLHPTTVLLMLVWMFVGASPGGTGGGIKTTTAIVLLSAIPAIARGEPRVVLHGRTLPLETVYRSAAIAVVSLLVVLGGTAMLLTVESHELVPALFEAVSAVATVGLSLGATAKLGLAGKTLVSLLMLLGRVGPLTLALLLAREGRSRVSYPEARVMVG